MGGLEGIIGLFRELGPEWGPPAVALVVLFAVSRYCFRFKGARGLSVVLNRLMLASVAVAGIVLLPYYWWLYRYKGLPVPFKAGQIGILVAEVPGDLHQEEQVAYTQAIRALARKTPELRGALEVRLLDRPLPADPEQQQAEAIKLGRWVRADFVLRPGVIEIDKVQEPYLTIVDQPEFSETEVAMGEFPDAELPQLESLPLPANLLLLARCALALSLYHQRSYASAAAELQQVVGSHELPSGAPSRPYLDLSLGNSLIELNRSADALVALNEAVRLSPRFVNAQLSIGAALAMSGDYIHAAAQFHEALDRSPNCEKAHVDFAGVSNALGFQDTALAEYEKAVRLKSDDPVPHAGLCTVLDEKGEYDQAISECKQAVALKKDYGAAYNELGLALRDKGQCDQSVSAFNMALSLKLVDAQVYNNLGSALACRNEFDGAIAEFRKALGLNPRFAHAYANLGSVLIQKGQYSEAIAPLRQAVKLEPWDAWPHRNLARALMATGKTAQAQLELQRAESTPSSH